MKKTNIYYLIAILLSGFIFQSCEEDIDIDLNSDQQKRLVLYGYLTTDTMKHELQLTYTADYFFNKPPVPANNSVVKVVEYDDAGLQYPTGRIIEYEEVPEKDGTYITKNIIYAIEKKYYKLTAEVTAADIQGTYEAVSYCPPINRDDDFHIELEFQEDWGKDGYFEVKVWYQDPPSQNWYLFNIYKNGILLTDTLDQKQVSDDTFYNGSNTNGVGVGYLNQSKEREKVYPGDTIVFQAGSVTEEYAIFMWEAQEEINFGSPLFDGPPANISSNISNGAFGFFAVFSTNYAGTTYNP